MTEERILDFLDGNLGASDEEELLHRLAVSPERRNLLKQHLQVRELTASLARRQYVSVPKMVTTSLFTTLAANGYAGPHIPSELNQKETLIASLEKNLGKSAEKIVAAKSATHFRRILAIASIVSFLLGAGVLYMLMPEARQDKFAANISNVFRGALSTPVAASSSLQSPIVSFPDQQSAKNLRTTSNSGILRDQSGAGVGNSMLNNKVEANFIPITELIVSNDVNDVAENVSTNSEKVIGISTVDSKIPIAISSIEDVHGTANNPFDPVNHNEHSDRSFLERLTFSFRAGEGKAPGNSQALTGSLIEARASYDISDLFVAKISIGSFMPYETQAIVAKPGFNNDGIPLLQLSSVLQYKYMVGAEVGAKFNMFSAPFELTAGFISDLKGSTVPRAGFFTNLTVNDNFSMNLGVEGMIYTHDIRSSIRNAQNSFAGAHPLLIGSLQEKESTGFIGPAIEMVWRF